MAKSSFSDLTPTFFLQTFVLELMHQAEQQGRGHNEELIESIAKTAGRFFEETYRDDFELHNKFDIEHYVDLILQLKNKIGGGFSLDSADSPSVKVLNHRCPFGDGVKHFPELCRMTSSVFGGIAARNFGYAKVEISKSIARNDGCCEVSVHFDKEQAKTSPGLEYSSEKSSGEKTDIAALHSKIEENMQKIWSLKDKKRKQKKVPVIVAKSPVMQKVLQAIEKVAPTVATVLIKGETGVGKELAASAIHAMSERSEQVFMAINCGAIPESLIESVLFGHEKGAFTGAAEIHQGVFERADGGTLFLDEVDTLSPAAQTRLLRVIQEGEMERVGGKRVFNVDVRLISATNQELESCIAEGSFRKDLFYRLNVVKLEIPRLTDRTEDFPYLVQVILQRLNEKYNKHVESVTRDVMNQIRHYHWPGNIRELENVLERAILFCDSHELKSIDIDKKSKDMNSWQDIRKNILEKAEFDYLCDALQRSEGDVTEVAKLMEVTPRTIYGKLKNLGIEASEYRNKAKSS